MPQIDILKEELRILETELEKFEIETQSKKIQLNGSFGKFGSKYSFLYSPQLLLQTTLTGQLCLLMLIERISAYADILSANTDGVTFRYSKSRKPTIDKIIARWEQDTSFVTEETEYRALYSANVNNYLAIKTDGKIKSKGAFTPAGLNKNPTCEICVDAVIAYLKTNTPLSVTIHDCKDFTKFLAVRKVTGGAVHEGTYLGRVVRFYYRKHTTTAIHYKTNGYLVPKTEGAWPCMELPDEFPTDIDYSRYVSEAGQMLRDIGERLW